MSDSDYSDPEFILDSELESGLQRLESGSPAPILDEPPISSSAAYEEALVEELVDLRESAAGGPALDIELEGDEEDMRSLYSAFRRRGFFSVSDLVGPLYCEVQYDYRLRSKPYLPAELRPTSITTSTGASIPVNKTLAVSRDKIMAKGDVVHKKLEKEIHPVEVKVTTTSKEDVWGLRLLNMFANLEALLTVGKCRELPVMGFVDGYMVVGVIVSKSARYILKPMLSPPVQDEIVRKPLVAKGSLTTYFASNRRTHALFLSDSKTRSSGTMPKEEHVQSGRYQLMIYKELLDAMIVAGLGGKADTVVDAFSWPALWRQLRLDPTTQLSTSFLDDAGPVILSNGLRHGIDKARTLDDLTASWSAYVQDLGLGAFPGGGKDAGRTDTTLELVYRTTVIKKKARQTGETSSESTIIGTQRFAHSPANLTAHLQSVLGFWLGRRSPIGVPEEHASRCGWCEFEEGCEWR